MSAHEVDSWEGELLLALSTLLLVEVDCGALHLDNLVLEGLDVLHILVELLLRPIDLLHLTLKILQQELL